MVIALPVPDVPCIFRRRGPAGALREPPPVVTAAPLMSTRRAIEFGPYRLVPAERAIYREGQLVPLPLKAVEVLLVLADAPGRIVSREELIRRVWPDVVVEEGNLSRHVSTLRSVLVGAPDSGQYIETVPKRGYRFVAPFRWVEEGVATATQPPLPADESAVPRAGPAPHLPPPSRVASAFPGRAASAPSGAETPGVAVPAGSARARIRSAWFGGAVTAAAVGVLASAGWVLWRAPDQQTARLMLAVLPVANLTGDADREILSDGLTEELIGRIGRLEPSALGVIARTSSMAYKGQRKTVAHIGRELGVDFVLEGSLRWVEERPRVAVQLVRVRDQSPVWAREYDRPLRELSTLPDEVAVAVALEARLPLSPETHGRLASRRGVDPRAYQAYLAGRYHLALRTRKALEQSLEDFRKAVEIEPAFAPAHAGLADSHNLLQFYGYTRGAVGIIYAREAAQRALALDDGLAEGHAALGYVNFMWLWEWPAAEREFRRAIALDANHAPAHHWYALFLAAMGRPEEARREIELARRLDPVSRILGAAAGYVAFYGRDYPRAERECRSVLEDAPEFLVARAVLGMALTGQGRHAEAVDAFREAIELDRGATGAYLGDLGHAQARFGNRDGALATLARLDDWARQGVPVQYGRALVHVGLGDAGAALESLEIARSQSETAWLWLPVDPRMDSLRSLPGYQQVLRNRPPQILGSP